MRRSFISIMVLSAALARVSAQSPGDLDPDFNPNTGMDGPAFRVAVQHDGRILIAGLFGQIKRLYPDGSLDASFRSGLNLTTQFRAGALLPLSDGGILIGAPGMGGGIISDSGRRLGGLVRLTSDGDVDPSFNVSGLSFQSVLTALEEPNEELVVGGIFSLEGVLLNIAKFGPDGLRDTNFTASANGKVNSIARQPDGKMLVAGSFTLFNGEAHTNLVRINSDGTVDPQFQPDEALAAAMSFGTTPLTECRMVARDSNGNAVIVLGNASGAVNSVIRLLPDGSADPEFKPADFNGYVADLAIQIDGAVLVGGSFSQVDGLPLARLIRLKADGTVDSGFHSAFGDVAGSGFVNSIALQTDSKLLVAGQSGSNYPTSANESIGRLIAEIPENSAPSIRSISPDTEAIEGSDVVLRVNATGWPVPKYQWKFNGANLPGATSNRLELHGIWMEDDGTYTVEISNAVGSIESSPATLTVLPPRTSPGSVDLGFVPPSADGEHIPWGMVEDSDGRYLSADLDRSSLPVTFQVDRLLSDGRPDPAFHSARFRVDSGTWALTMAVGLDGRIFVGGDFDQVNETPRRRLAALNSDGTLDTSFQFQEEMDSFIRKVVPLESGDLIIAGDFTQIGTEPRNHLARITSDGQLEAAFRDWDEESPFTYVTNPPHPLPNTIAVLPDGNLLVDGYSISSNNAPLILAKLDAADGHFDSWFSRLSAGDPLLERGFLVENGGSVLVNGSLTTSNLVRYGVFRLKADGEIDSEFDAGLGVDDRVDAMAKLPNGKILLAGTFRSVQGIARPGLARLNSDGSLDRTFDPGTGADGSIHRMIVTPDSSVLLGGDFTHVDGIPRAGIAKLRGNGRALAALPDRTGSEFSVKVWTWPGRQFHLDATDSFDSQEWERVDEVAGDGTLKILRDSNASGPYRFYSVTDE